MPEIAFITQIKDEPMALAVLGAMVVYKLITELAKYILPLISKKKKKSVEEMLADDARERKIRQADLDAKLGEIETSIAKLFSIVADHEELYSKVSQGTLENMLFNDDLPVFRRLKSFLRLIAMRVNGRIREKGFALILQNKETWKDALEAHVDLKIVDRKYFDEVLEDIEKRIFRY